MLVVLGGEVSKHVNVELGSNSATRTPNVVNVGFESFPTVSEAHGTHYPASANEGNMNDDDTNVGLTLADNIPRMSSYANVTGVPSRKALNFCTLFTTVGNRVDVVVSVESIITISECSIYGFDVVLENGPWFIRNNPLILKSGIRIEDGLSTIATKLGTPLMLDSYTSDMCIQSWGMLSYDRALIKVRADGELKDNIVVAMPKLVMEGFNRDECPKNIDSDVVKNMKCLAMLLEVFRSNKKKDVEPTIEVSNSNPFDVLNSFENDVDLGTKMLIIDEKVTLVDDVGKPLSNVDSSGDHDSEDEKTYENDDYDFHPYDDDMYEGHDIPDKIQAICDRISKFEVENDSLHITLRSKEPLKFCFVERCA
ncbi:hypothetical protein Tco_0371507 [Tanacetum coccineum]